MSPMLDDIFHLLEVANKLEESRCSRIEAATKYYEAVYLMRRYVQRIPETSSEVETRQLLLEKASHYEQVAASLMADDASATAVFTPRSPIDKETFFHEDSSVVPVPPPSFSNNSFSSAAVHSEYIDSRAGQANNRLAQALDLDEASQSTQALSAYMEAAELYLEAIKRANELDQSANLQSVVEVMKRRLQSTLDRIEMIKEGKKIVVPQHKVGERVKGVKPNSAKSTAGQLLSPEEIAVLKRSSMIASGLFLPWSDDDAMVLTESAMRPKSLFKDPDGFLPLSSKQLKRFHKWARPSEIVKTRQQAGLTRTPQKVELIRHITPYSIRQQYITDCSFIASLCICAAFERRFQKQLVSSILFPQTADGTPLLNPEGKYMVKLWLNGVARCVTIDDYLPIDKHGNLMCSQSSPSANCSYLELWVCLIEKAYMKLCGGYDFPGSNSGVDLFSLTGWIPERILFADDPLKVRDFETAPERAWERLFSASSYGDCLITVSTERIGSEEEVKSSGLVTGHAYAVLSCILTKNGTRLLQLKNPWAHQSWKGRYSCTDTVGWSDPSFCAEVGYDPQKASLQDDGVFWICWEDILRYFQNIHLSWNPSLFSFVARTHGFWKKELGPDDDTFNVGENPQYILALSEKAIQRHATIWILISRHVTKQEQEGSDAKDFLTIHIHRNSAKQRRIWYPGQQGNCILTGAYTNNPHVLVRYDVVGPQDAYLSLILSQYQKSNDLGYTLACFCTESFSLGQPASSGLEHSIERTSAWTPGRSGGPLGTPNCDNNPTFAVSIPEGVSKKDVKVQIRVTTNKTIAVNVILAPVAKFGEGLRDTTGPPVIDSGKYRHGFVATEPARVPSGNYVLLISTFTAGVTGDLQLIVASSSNMIRVQERK